MTCLYLFKKCDTHINLSFHKGFQGLKYFQEHWKCETIMKYSTLTFSFVKTLCICTCLQEKEKEKSCFLFPPFLYTYLLNVFIDNKMDFFFKAYSEIVKTFSG